ncbi:terminase gpA endonuclease subunit [Sphingobium yanoikuyae]|uniref:phage terminase large subunit family protein n=1 Tax=Sphingobium yanoikuyae TaxID=13690 RepID=UPI0028B026FF|nr:terminase gpA endonuclease subunit [Sphingobium yanoikuyae]
MSISSSQTLETRKPISPQSAKADRLRAAAHRGWAPPPRISVPDWADGSDDRPGRMLAKEAGSTSGRWRTSTVEIARGAMLAVTEPGVHKISLMVCTQLMKTAFIENTVGYFAELDPCPMMIVQPKEDAAEKFSKERITPLIRATPSLRAIFGYGKSKTRNADETLLYKAFPGGFLALEGAGSPDNLARRPLRVALMDEFSKYPITREGNPGDLVDERMATFANWLSIRTSSPTIADECLIEASYNEGDQRQASVECPHCQHRQFLDFFKHVHWEKDEETGEHHTAGAAIHCEACGAEWSEGQRLLSLRTTRWHQTRAFHCCGKRHDPLEVYERAWREPDEAAGRQPIDIAWNWWASDRWAVYRATCPDCGRRAVDNEHASFTASKLFSPWPKDAPPKIAAKWIAAKDDPDKRVTFDNTQLGRPHKRQAAKDIAAETLMRRAEQWPGEVPDGVGIITVGGDTQDDRVELEFVGWGHGEESWSLDHVVVEGDPATEDLWRRVDKELLRRFKRADGREFTVTAGCIDSGGHHTQKVYAFAKARLGRNIWAVKGQSARNGERSPVWPTTRPSAANRSKFKPVIVGTNAAKDSIRWRLGIEEPGPGYMHFEAKRDLGWYIQMVAERLITKVVSGRRFTVWDLPKGKANEALDCRVYAYAALMGLMQRGMKLNMVVDAVSAAPEKPDPHPPKGKAAREGAAPKPQRPTSKFAARKSEGWMKRRR